ncbi:MAG: hypothetical protein GX986_08015 [Firmicutes bacterium]|nr:hypothetical protein [Bacillota bacterium]
MLRQVLLLQLPVQTFFETIGDYIVGQLKEYVTQVSSPPNHPFTVAAKGSSQPLIDTGRMRDAITHRVVKG